MLLRMRVIVLHVVLYDICHLYSKQWEKKQNTSRIGITPWMEYTEWLAEICAKESVDRNSRREYARSCLLSGLLEFATR